MSLLSLKNISISFGALPLLDHADLQIEKGERLCLVGRNGEGKSTLMKLINEELLPDDGAIARKQNLRVSRLAQEVPHDLSGSVYDIVAKGVAGAAELLQRHQEVSEKIAEHQDESLLSELKKIQHQLDSCGGWQLHQQIGEVLAHLQLQAHDDFSTLSGGQKRRVLLAKALVANPDLLLLDEPTNHLDIEAIAWLETFLKNLPATLLFISHDRMLIRKLATRIVELDRGRLTSFSGNYDAYIAARQKDLEVEATQQQKFDKKLAGEEAWIRQGIKARRTRNEGRVRALLAMRAKRKERRQLLGKAEMRLQEAHISGKLVISARNVCFHHGERILLREFSTDILRGDKVGIIGPNGSGKTTLLRLLLGSLPPEQGTIRQGTNLEVAYFDQHREILDEEKSVADNVAEGSDFVTVNGVRKHIVGYLREFLFTPDRTLSPVKILSGGERNRLLLARLFTKPSNLLILDEPTNDLDVETLELLEELLVAYKGTILLVSHDREFLNNVVTSTLVFEGNGSVVEYAGGFDDWLSQRPCLQEERKDRQENRKKEPPSKVRPRKLTYREERELENLPLQIEQLESEQQELYTLMAEPSFYQQESASIAASKEKLAEIETSLHRFYERWEELEKLKEELAGK